MIKQPHILCIDGYNFMHRARSGFTKGDYAIVFNFFRNLRALIEAKQPTQVYFVIEGHPRERHAMMEGYKANRLIDPLKEPERHETMVRFHHQKLIIIGFLKSFFPVTVFRHPHHECDDVIFNLINKSSTEIPWTVVSNDTDFIQLLQEFNHVTLYNPMKKENVIAPEYDYISWKALRGDGSDNIPGVPGIGDKRAEALVKDLDLLATLMRDDPAMQEVFLRNTEMIRFLRWTHEESLEMQSFQAERPMWDSLAIGFEGMNFKSLLKEKTFKKFTDTFDPLWEK